MTMADSDFHITQVHTHKHAFTYKYTPVHPICMHSKKKFKCKNSF